MSISMQDISPEMLCNCQTESRHGRGWREPWNQTVRQCFIPFKGNDEDFLTRVVPNSDHPFVLDDSMAPATPTLRGSAQEHRNVLVGFLNELVSCFPDDKRPAFFDCSKRPQEFPFHALAADRAPARIDIAMTFPGQCAPNALTASTWRYISALVQVKAHKNDDPFRQVAAERSKSLVQLSLAAHSLMHAHGSLAVFAIGMYGDFARIVRFDRAGAVYSRRINIAQGGGELKILIGFLWALVNPASVQPIPGRVVGCDQTTCPLTAEDWQWLKVRLGQIDPDTQLEDSHMDEARAALVYNQDDATPQRYLMYKPLDACSRLFSRGTTAWLAVRDTRPFSAPSGDVVFTVESEDDFQVRVVKETWRRLFRPAETGVYERLNAISDSRALQGLQTMLVGSDLGEREVYGRENPLGPVLEGKAHRASPFEPHAKAILHMHRLSLGPRAVEDACGVGQPLHQTFTYRQFKGREYWESERSHVRFVVSVVGKDIEEFEDTKELTEAFRDIIRGKWTCYGHYALTTFAGVVHRDISFSNIMIAKRICGKRSVTGFLHDFDYSSMTKSPPNDSPLTPEMLLKMLLSDCGDSEMKVFMGTQNYAAIERMFPTMEDGNEYQELPFHEVKHDIESFYWVLLCVVLWGIHTNGSEVLKGEEELLPVTRMFNRIFTSRQRKLKWLQEQASKLVVTDNAPLTLLLHLFGQAVLNSVTDATMPLTHDKVLEIFDGVLGGWPAAHKDGPKRCANHAENPGLTADEKCRCAKSRNRRRELDFLMTMGPRPTVLGPYDDNHSFAAFEEPEDDDEDDEDEDMDEEETDSGESEIDDEDTETEAVTPVDTPRGGLRSRARTVEPCELHSSRHRPEDVLLGSPLKRKFFPPVDSRSHTQAFETSMDRSFCGGLFAPSPKRPMGLARARTWGEEDFLRASPGKKQKLTRQGTWLGRMSTIAEAEGM